MQRGRKPVRKPIFATDGSLMNEVAAAAYVGLAVSTLQNRRSKKMEPKFRKIGRAVFYDKNDLDSYLRGE